MKNIIKSILLLACFGVCHGGPPEYDAGELRRGLRSLKEALVQSDASSNAELVAFLESAAEDASEIQRTSDFSGIFNGLRAYLRGKTSKGNTFSFIRWPLPVKDVKIFGRLAYESRISYLSDAIDRAENGRELSEDDLLWIYIAVSQLGDLDYREYYGRDTLTLFRRCIESNPLMQAFAETRLTSESKDDGIFYRNILDATDSLYLYRPEIVFDFFEHNYKNILMAHISALREVDGLSSNMLSLRGQYLDHFESKVDFVQNFSKYTEGLNAIYGHELPSYVEVAQVVDRDQFSKLFFERRGVVINDELNSNKRELLESFANLIAYYDHSGNASQLKGKLDPRIMFLHVFGL